MNLMELYQPTPAGFATPEQDNSVYKIDDNRGRQTRLTLDRLNRLRIMNDTRKLEHEQKLEKVADQYKIPAQPSGGL